MQGSIKILLIEDNPDHIILITRSLKKDFPVIKIIACQTAAEALGSLKKKKYDLILMDYKLNDSSEMNLLNKLTEHHRDIPVIVITGEGDEHTAAKAIKAGAEDYIVKTRESLETLPKTILQAIHRHRKTSPSQLKPSKKRKPENLFSSIYRDLESMTSSLKNFYRDMKNPKLKDKRSSQELKKISHLGKQLGGVQEVIRTLLRKK